MTKRKNPTAIDAAEPATAEPVVTEPVVTDPVLPEPGHEIEPVEQRFWINAISLEHVTLGVAGGFVQADHGKQTRLRWLHRGDWIVMYSPRGGIREGATVQAFTALGIITDDEPYQVTLRPDVEPWRRRVEWLPCAAAEVRPLLPDLTFVIDKVQWGFPFRRGLFRIDGDDFARIASTMAPAWRADGQAATGAA